MRTLEALETFLGSPDFYKGCRLATVGAWRGHGVSVALYAGGEWSLLLNGNRSREEGAVSIPLPQLDDSDLYQCLSAGMDEEEYFTAAFECEYIELCSYMREALQEVDF